MLARCDQFGTKRGDAALHVRKLFVWEFAESLRQTLIVPFIR